MWLIVRWVDRWLWFWFCVVDNIGVGIVIIHMRVIVIIHMRVIVIGSGSVDIVNISYWWYLVIIIATKIIIIITANIVINRLLWFYDRLLRLYIIVSKWRILLLLSLYITNIIITTLSITIILILITIVLPLLSYKQIILLWQLIKLQCQLL